MSHRPLAIEIKTWRDAQRVSEANGGKCVRQAGSHMMYKFPIGKQIVLCDKGNETIKPGLRSAIIKAFLRWGVLCLALALVWAWLA